MKCCARRLPPAAVVLNEATAGAIWFLEVGVRSTPLQQVRINAGSAFARAQVLRLADTAEIGGM